MRIMRNAVGCGMIFCALVFGVLAADAPAKFKVSEFEFTRPAGWDWVDVSSSPMRKAQLKVSNAGKTENGEAVFYYFGQSGAGGTQANIDRWLGQFQEPKDKLKSKVESVTVGKRKATFVQAEGTYMNGMPGGAPTPQPNSMLLGAILESEQGNVFVKFTGPAKLVKASEGTFKKMIRSALE